MGLSSDAPGSPDIGSILGMIGGGGNNPGTYNNSTSNTQLPPWANGSGGTFGGSTPGRPQMPAGRPNALAPPPGQDLASLLQQPQVAPMMGGRGGAPPMLPPQAASTPGTGFMSMLTALAGNRGVS